MQTPAMNVEQLEDFLRREFSQFFHSQSGLTIEDATHGGARVRQAYSTQFIRPGGQPLPIDFAMRKTDQGWKVYDITVEGVSLVLTYRSEFDSVVKQEGIDGLIKRLTQKNVPPAAVGGSAPKK